MKLSGVMAENCGWKVRRARGQPSILPCRPIVKRSASAPDCIFSKKVVKVKDCMQSRQQKILVVDDEPDILEFLQELLEQEGYAVTTTDNAECLENLQNGGLPDL